MEKSETTRNGVVIDKYGFYSIWENFEKFGNYSPQIIGGIGQ